MSANQMADFLDSVRVSGLLTPPQWDAVREFAAAQSDDPEAVPKYIARLGMLSPLQVKLFWRGRGSDLFLNQYVLVEKLGEGGMGEVFRAKHTRMDRDVALKVIRRERMLNPEMVKRFRREIRAAAALAHENVVMAYDADQAGDIHFFAMEFVDGTNLARLVIQKGALTVAMACDYIRQTATGLQHAHEKGLIHRDIKPANLLITKTGIVKISDMGLARLEDAAGADSVSRITKDGLVVGTPDYVAPEQARDSHAADIRSDVYSLGCTLYYLLCADVPYPGGTPTEKMLRHAREPFPVPKRTDLPPGLDRVLVKMTAKKREQRFQTPGELAEALEEYIPRKAVPVFIPPVPIPGTEPLDDEPSFSKRPPLEESTDSRFRLPSSAALPRAPRSRKSQTLIYSAAALMIFGVLLIVSLLVFGFLMKH
ncbi:serine/threonine-protein kinase [Zavarzinella formosa]|uniref:serine/threonine-protein kinase n=1 Tax=Zavarzinella formosa TaxID=360055 RepID=UPI0002F930B3|nr:serine/threonine-protein kinase [Zavarzinella formosa]